MERNRKERVVLSTVAELFDLPADVVAGLPRLEMVGSRQLYLEPTPEFWRTAKTDRCQYHCGGTAGTGRGIVFAGHDGGGAAHRRAGCRGGVGEVAPC